MGKDNIFLCQNPVSIEDKYTRKRHNFKNLNINKMSIPYTGLPSIVPLKRIYVKTRSHLCTPNAMQVNSESF